MSGYRIYAGNKKALVFPIMGDGYVHLDYSKHIPTGADITSGTGSGIELTETRDDDDAKYGLWAHTSSFTMEGVITPYDINGFGYRLGLDYQTSGNTPVVHTNYGSDDLDLPFNSKFQSMVGRVETGVNSRSSAYFGNTHLCYLAVAVNGSATTLVLSSVEDIVQKSIIRIGNEKMTVVSVSSNLGLDCIVTVERRVNGATNVSTSHAAGAKVYGDNRLNHKMVIFHNETCQFYLKNMTRTTMNQPAEYKIGCVLKGKDVNGHINTVTVESDAPVITAEEQYYGRTIEQPAGTEHVFGTPVYLTTNDIVRYHKLVNTSNSQIYIEPKYQSLFKPTASTHVKVGFGNSSGDGVGNIIGLQSGSFPSDFVSGSLIKVTGSLYNDGIYTIETRTSGDSITIVSPITGQSLLIGEVVVLASNDVTINGVYERKHQYSFSDGSAAYLARESISYDTNNIDMSPHIWKGMSYTPRVIIN